MDLGWITFWGGDVQAFKEQVRYAESVGISAIMIGDSPASWNELYVSLTLVALETHVATIGPMVGLPLLRHPVVHARAMSSLADLTKGRAVLGLGTGASGAAAIGRPPLTQDEMRDYIRVMRQLFRGEEASWQGSTVAALKCPIDVPIIYSGWGPRSLALAGEVADGVIFKVGSSLDAVVEKISMVRTAASRAGRDPADVEIWAYSYLSFAESKPDALTSIGPLLAASGRFDYLTPHAIRAVPEDLLDPLRELQRRYDVSQHAVVGGPNGTLVDELGLAEFLAGRAAVVGDRAEIADYLYELEQAGVTRFCFAGTNDQSPQEGMERLAECESLREERHGTTLTRTWT